MKPYILAAVLATVLFVPTVVMADSFTITQTFGDVTISDHFTYAFDLTALEALAQSLDSATLSLTHQGNSNNPGEVWLSSSGGGTLIGTLSASTAGNNFVTDSWVLGPSILAEIMGQDPWKLTIKLDDTTTGTDKITIRDSVLVSDYTPIDSSTPSSTSIPEPSSALLLGAGVAGLKFLRRRK